jgi:hypothetical protein
LEGDALHSFVYAETNLPAVGAMEQGYAFDTTGTLPTHRDFHLQLLASEGQQLEDIKYKINRISGAIEGNDVLAQTAIESSQNGTPYMMNYGVSHAALPLGDQSYIYVGQSNKQWMQDAAKILPDLTVQDLVLSGSHDAGMYQINIADASAAIEQLKAEYPILGKLYDLAESVAGTQVLRYSLMSHSLKKRLHIINCLQVLVISIFDRLMPTASLIRRMSIICITLFRVYYLANFYSTLIDFWKTISASLRSLRSPHQVYIKALSICRKAK